MPLIDTCWPGRLWWGAAVILAAYLALFLLARRPVSLRLERLEWLALVVFGLRLVLLALGRPPATYLDLSLTTLALLGTVGLGLRHPIWLARVVREELSQQIWTACRGLFLTCEEPAPGRFLLTAKDGTWQLRTWSLSRRVQVVCLPRPAGPSKVSLLVQWLSKQYPGPVPRVRIVLTRSAS